jgi:hypothetical protein
LCINCLTQIFDLSPLSAHSVHTRRSNLGKYRRISLKTMSFERFSCLPLELRLKIWEYCIPGPRIVNVVAVTTYEENRFEPRSPTGWVSNFLLRISAGSRPSEYSSENEDEDPARTHTLRRRYRTQIQYMCTTTPSESSEWLVQVNAEARKAIGKVFASIPATRLPIGRREHMAPTKSCDGYIDDAYALEHSQSTKGFGDHDRYFLNYSLKAGPQTLFNPKKDVLFLADPQYLDPKSWEHEDLMSSLDILLRWLDPRILAELKYLAIPYATWRRDRTYGHLARLREFKNLKRIWVCFLGETEETGPIRETAWISVVRLGDSSVYFRQAEEQVLGDWKDLGRQWGKVENQSGLPDIEVVIDRAALTKIMHKSDD